MAHSQQLGLPAIRTTLKLANHIHDLPADPVVRKKALVHGLSQLLDARLGLCFVLQFDMQAVRHSILSSVYCDSGSKVSAYLRHLRTFNPPNPAMLALYKKFSQRPLEPVTCAREELVNDRDWYASAYVQQVRKTAGIDHCVFSLLPLTNTYLAAALILNRVWGDRRRFSPLDCQLLQVIHTEMAWIYRADIPFASPEVSDLPPRQKQTLQYLLAGNSEKQIAAQTGLSRNTIHHYVKALYRRFGVSSRSELLVRWVNK